MKILNLVEGKVALAFDVFLIGCKKLIQSLILAMPDFANVGAFLLFVFILIAAMGLQIYNGVQYN